jgi:hypothetical protein
MISADNAEPLPEHCKSFSAEWLALVVRHRECSNDLPTR